MSFLQNGELFIIGTVAGLFAGYFGIGGGILLTPLTLALYGSMGFDDTEIIKVIFGTNMLLATVFSLSAVIKQHTEKNIEWKTVLRLAPLAVAGSAAGAWSASVSDPSNLKKAFAVILMISAVMIVTKGFARLRFLKHGHTLVPCEFLPLLGFAAGLIGSYIGIGGGAVLIPLLVLLFNYPIGKVAGTSSAVIIFIGLTGTAGYMCFGREVPFLPGLSTGYVWWSSALPLMLGGIPAAQAGAWLNLRTHTKLLQQVFGTALFIMGVRFLF